MMSEKPFGWIDLKDKPLAEPSADSPALVTLPRSLREPPPVKHGLTYREIGERLNLTARGVQYIERKALRKLRGLLAEFAADLLPAEAGKEEG